MSTVQLANFASGTGVFDATMYNGATLDSSPAVGNADLSLNAASSQYVKMTTSFTSQSTGLGNGMSVAGWFLPMGTQNIGSTLFDISGTTNAISLYYDTANTVTGFYNGTNVSSSTYPVTTNAWHFFCYTIFCNSSNNAVQTLYIDNPNAVAFSKNTGTFSQVVSNTSYLGWGYGNAGATNYTYFNGKLDDFRFYNRILTTPEISVLYNYNYSTNTITPVNSGLINTTVSYTNGVRLDLYGTFSGVSITRTPAFSGGSAIQVSAANLTSFDNLTWSYYDTTALQGITYSYSITPYVTTTYGSATAVGSVYTSTLLNGLFNTLNSGSLPIANTFNSYPQLAYWTVVNGSNPYYLCAGTNVNTYTGTLPSSVTYYLDLYTAPGTSSSLSQYVTFNYFTEKSSSSTFSGTVCFYAWPADNTYNTGCSLSVMLNGVKLLNAFTFSTGAAVPYTSFALPFTVTNNTSNLITFTVYNSSGTGSAICIAGVQVNTQASIAVRYNTVDPSMQQLYYPMDLSYGTVGKIYNYASGTGTGTSGTLNGNTTLLNTSLTPIIGNGYLYTDATTGTYLTLDSWTCPTNATTSGFSIAGWIYPLSIAGNPTVCYLSNGTNSVSITLTSTGALGFSFNNTGGNYIINNFNVSPNRWYFIAVTASGTANSIGTYNFYVNDISLGYSNTLSWPNTASSYTTNYLGGLPASPSIVGANGTLTNFNGYMDEFRVYNRTLSPPDILALWSDGFVRSNFSNLIDPSGLNLYFPLDMGTFLV